MTREEAIEVFKTEHPYNPHRKDNDLHTLAKAFDMAISALSENKGEKKVGGLTLREIKEMCEKKFDKELIFSCVPCSGSEFCPCDYLLKAPFLWDSADLEKELPRGDKAE